MTHDYSFAALIQFLDYLGDKGLMKKSTVVARKAAANKMFSVLNDEEKSDLRDTDLDDLSNRFHNLQGQQYKPKSLQVYKSRVSTALSDFLRYKENPASFKIESVSRSVKPKLEKPTVNRPVNNIDSPRDPNSTDTPSIRVASVDIPIPLRSNCIIQINGVPVDLTPSEAQKIANVISALAVVSEE